MSESMTAYFVVALADGRYLRSPLGTGAGAFAEAACVDAARAERLSDDYDGASDQPSVIAEAPRNVWAPGCGAEPYRVLAVIAAGERERWRLYWATSYAEALTMAEREDAGQEYAPITYGIAPCQYDRARAEGIAFNDADGLLV